MGITDIFAKSLAVALVATVSNLASATNLVQLKGHVPNKAMAMAVDLGSANAAQMLHLAIPLQPQNLSALEDLIQRQYTPGDALYGKYLTPAQFTARFAPTQAQYDQVVNYLRSIGLTDIELNPGRMLINVNASVSQVQAAFNVPIHSFYAFDGRAVYAPTAAPTVDANVANLIYGIVGLNNFATAKPHLLHAAKDSNPPGNGPQGGGLASADIKTVYNMTGITQTGAGQTLALAEFDGYTASDITTYEQSNNLPTLNLQNVYIDGFDGSPSMNGGEEEVTLDIELMGAIAPAAKIIVYEAGSPMTIQSFESEEIDVYNKIASDNLAKAVSSSWGYAEDGVDAATMKSENTSFMQMASQGQSVFVAAGDAGAYDDGSALSTDDPGSQPYVTSAGGTHLNVTSALAYQSESSWNTSTVSSSNGPEGGGGGISSQWPLPTWQKGLGTTTNLGSTTMRMVPDVSLDADPASGYSFYVDGSWGVVGGTSCVGPILAGFTGLVNQARTANGQAVIGYLNPVLAQIGGSSAYATTFHDIADGSTNLYYPAVAGYDLSTGWGSLIGQAAFTTLVGASSSTASN